MQISANVSTDWIKSLIRDFIATSPYTTLRNQTKDPAWEDALIGFASGADQIWQQYKEYLGPFHRTPWEVFNQHCRAEKADIEELTVISWVLPQREAVRKANRRTKKYPSEAWARVRVYGEEFNVALRRHVVNSCKGSPGSSGTWGVAATVSAFGLRKDRGFLVLKIPVSIKATMVDWIRKRGALF